ncbi:hypothetical protein [uncultured Kordia sp.]|uniref:hypothetical protein n=1 Tax=uncultured Kordia sp. TaxID=507699 RepID=UPI00263A17E9|nr:hypothetical protein [uncultured Kordia sp.]
MKRFALNKIKIARLENLQKIQGKGLDAPNGTTANLDECISITCEPSNLQMSCIVGVCTNTSIDTHDITDPIGTGNTTPK